MMGWIDECQGCNKLRKRPRKIECMIIKFANNEVSKDCPCNICILKANCSLLCDKLITYFFRTGKTNVRM